MKIHVKYCKIMIIKPIHVFNCSRLDLFRRTKIKNFNVKYLNTRLDRSRINVFFFLLLKTKYVSSFRFKPTRRTEIIQK